MAQTSTKRKNIMIAAIIVVILVVSSVGAVMVYNQLTTTRISLSLLTNQTQVIQGSSTQIQVNVDSKGNPENTTLIAIPNSTSIHCSFSPASGKSSFNSMLTVDVDDSVRGGNYSVTIKASSPTATANVSCILTVLSRNITVSGKIIEVSSHWDIWLDSLMFEDARTDQNVTTKLNGSLYSPDNGSNVTHGYTDAFTVTLKNQESYRVVANYWFGVLDFLPFSSSELIGNLTVSTPAASDIMSGQDFTLTVP